MKVSSVTIKNFRRLEDVQFSFEDDHTLFVGPNNSGKTSAAAAFRLFFKRGDFSINDFTVSCVDRINAYGRDPSVGLESLPAIEMDIWLSVDPDVEFGRVFSLLPNVSRDFEKVGIRLKFGVKDADSMIHEYNATFAAADGKLQKSLCHYLSLPNVLGRYFSVRYFALEEEVSSNEVEIEPDEGKRLLSSLIRVDFIDAQRNIHDQEGGRQNRLSAAFAAYYKFNLQKPEENEVANKVIDDNNSRLTEHYDQHFKPLLGIISALGVPSANDREMRLVSTLSPQEALRGSTELYYVDKALQHELPEAYNGLGFKNLVYMAIQISHFHAQWLTTEKNRELCQLIFVEEPEVHLHAQVQQIFIANMWKILKEFAVSAGEDQLVPQLVISTHSSHIVDTVEFEKIRYFRRCHAKGFDAGTLNASKVVNVKDFTPAPEDIAGTAEEREIESGEKTKREAEVIRFLKKYLKLTHCDLFFADAAILVEGTVEKLLLPQMIEKCAGKLQNKYITVLEVGGAFAHKFSGLLKFLGVPYLVITDIDTVDAADGRKACPASRLDSKTSNASLKSYFGKSTRADLVALKADEQVCAGGACYVTFQRPVKVTLAGEEGEVEMHGRTLEEAFVYENLAAFLNGALPLDIELAEKQTATEIANAVYEGIRATTFKKTEFALNVASSADLWVVPSYIANGLEWLESTLEPSAAIEVKPCAVAEVQAA